MPDEKMADGRDPVDAIDQVLREVGVVQDAPPPSQETFVAPAPGATVTETPAPAAAQPAAQAQPPVAADPSAPVQQPPAAAQPSEAERHMQMLIKQNQDLVKGTQEMVSSTKAIIENLLKEKAPEMTPEQRAAKTREVFEQLNTDPEAVITRIAEGVATRQAEALRLQLHDPQAEGARVANNQLAQLLAAPDGTIIRPEIQDPAFFRSMISVENQRAAMKSFPGQSEAALRANPAYYLEMYHQAKLSEVRKVATQPAAPSQGALDAQRAVIAGHGAAPAPGAGRTPGVDQAPDPDKAFKESLTSLNGGFSAVASGLQWQGKK